MFIDRMKEVYEDIFKRRTQEIQNTILENREAVSGIATLVPHPDGVLVVPDGSLVLGDQDLIGVVLGGGAVKTKEGGYKTTDGVGKL